MADRLVSGKGAQPGTYEDKIRNLSKNNVDLIVAAAGSLRIYKDILKIIESEIQTWTNDVVFSRINNIHSGIRMKPSLLDLSIDNEEMDNEEKFSMFVFTKKESRWIGFIVGERGTPSLEESNNYALGCGEKCVKPNVYDLEETKEKDQEEILYFGFHLMKYASKNFERAVGDPEVDLCDYIIFHNSGQIEEKPKSRPDSKLDLLKRMLYRFDDAYE